MDSPISRLFNRSRSSTESANNRDDEEVVLITRAPSYRTNITAPPTYVDTGVIGRATEHHGVPGSWRESIRRTSNTSSPDPSNASDRVESEHADSSSGGGTSHETMSPVDQHYGWFHI